LFGDGAGLETGIEEGAEGQEGIEPADQGAGLPAVRKPGIGLVTELARQAGDGSDACH